MQPAPNVEAIVLRNDRLWRLQVAGRDTPNGRAVVFVHGFTGDADNTWRASETSCFPHLLARDLSFQDHDVFLFQYSTNFFFPPKIENIVQQMKAAFDEHLGDREIVLIAHSMGGLVCMHYVLRQLENAVPVKVVGLLTYGTPMSGVEWLRYAGPLLKLTGIKIPVIGWIAGLFSKNRQLEEMRAGGEFIDRLTSQWVLRVLNGGYPSIPPNLRTWLPTRVVSGNDDWVVKEGSAKGFYGDIDWIPVDRGHIAMIKPPDTTDEAYQIATNFVRQCKTWIGSSSALKLRQQADFIWGLYRSRRISNWKFDMSFTGKEAPGGSAFGLPSFGEFVVRECSYTRLLDPVLKFGFALGSIATDNLWNDQFVFLHRILFRGMSPLEQKKIIDDLRVVLKNPVNAWQTLFDKPQVTIGTGPGAIPLKTGDPVAVDDGIVCDLEVPKDLVGKEKRVNVSFRSLVPLNIRHYRIEFPWLCEEFATTASFERPLAFLAAGQAMRGSVQAQATEEGFGKMSFRSQDLILPGSYIQMEWRFSEEGQKA